MGKSGAWEAADVGFVPGFAAFLCNLGCSIHSGAQSSYFGKEEMNFCSSFSIRLLKESRTKTVKVRRDVGA